MFTNNTNIPLAMAVWLLHSDYDSYPEVKNYISATTLLKNVKKVILANRARGNVESDISDFIPSVLGSSIHDSIERSWTKGDVKRSMKLLGYPPGLLERLVINPESVKDGEVPIYLEQRSFKEIDGFTVGGKFDFVENGMLQDHKSTSTYTWTKGTKDDDYILQGSIYRWLNQEIITDDFMQINFLFTDWQKSRALSDKDYPQSRIISKKLKLLSIPETEAWIKSKLRELVKYQDSDQDALPECTDKDLWRDPPVYKYFSNPDAARATKNFDNLAEANTYAMSKGKGVVKTVPGEPKACNWCPAFNICNQRKRMISDV